jgi:transcriptional regulator GlxA family with amidase domain
MKTAGQYDVIVVVGGLLHEGQCISHKTLRFIKSAAESGVNIAGVCTGSFALAKAGLLDGYVTCVSWFHRDEFRRTFPHLRIVSSPTYIVDRERLTCAGGTSVVHLAANVIERTLGPGRAVKALRILIEDQPLSARQLQPASGVSFRIVDRIVQRAMLLMEENVHSRRSVQKVAGDLGVSPRQLERRFQVQLGTSPISYLQRLRLHRATWLLENTDLQVTEIAFECGFGDGSSFSRALRKVHGVTPSQIRRSGQATATG